MNKADYFQTWNGKVHSTESEGDITLTLRKSWTIEQMHQVVKAWQAKVDEAIAFDTWKAKLTEHAAALNYTKEDVRWSDSLIWSNHSARDRFKKKQSIEESIVELEKSLFEKPSRFQFGIIEQLLPDNSDRIIRLIGNGTIVVGTSRAGVTEDWQTISPKGEVLRSTLETALSAKLYAVCCKIRLSDQFGVQVEAIGDSSQYVNVYFGMKSHTQENWYRVEVSRHTIDIQRNPLPKLNIYGCSGSIDVEIASRVAKALDLGAMIAHNFDAFLDQPRVWLGNYQAEQGQLL